MNAFFISFAKYNKEHFPKFLTVTTEDDLESWIEINGGVDYLKIENYFQSPNSGQISIPKKTLVDANMAFPNYVIVYDVPLSRPFGYFLTFYGVGSNTNIYTFDCEIDPLFYPSTRNASFRADLLKSNNKYLKPNQVDTEKLLVGDKFFATNYVLMTPLEQVMKDNDADTRGWIVYVSAKDWTTDTINGLHYFVIPYMPKKGLRVGSSGGLASFNQLHSMSEFKTDNNIVGIYYVPYCPIASMLTYTDGTIGQFTITASSSLEVVTVNGYQVFALKSGLAFSAMTVNNLQSITASTMINWLSLTNTAFEVGEVSYALGNSSYSEIASNDLVRRYPASSSLPISVVTTFSDRVAQYIKYGDALETNTKEIYWTAPEINPMFSNDSYLTFLKNRTGTLWSSALLGITAQGAGALMGDVSSAIGLGVSVLSTFNNINSEYNNARNQRDSIRNSNNSQMLSQMIVFDDIYVRLGYRYNDRTVSYNRFSVIRPNVTLAYSTNNIEYVRFTDFVNLPLYTELERSMLPSRGIVRKL